MRVRKYLDPRRLFARPLGPNATFRARNGFPPGKQATWPCKVPRFLGPIATRVCSGAVKHVLPATLGGRSAAFSRSDCDPGRGGCPGDLQEAPRPGPGIAEGNFISKSYQKSLKNYQMKARAVPPPCRGFKKLKNTRVWTGPPRKRQHYRGFRHGPRQMPRGSATFFFEVLGLRAVGLSFVASADIYVVFWGNKRPGRAKCRVSSVRLRPGFARGP